MNWIAWILLGAIAGFIAEKLTKNNMGLIMNIIVGLIGSVLGGWLFGMLGIGDPSSFVGSVIVATVGAVVLLLIVGMVKKKG